MALSLRQRVYRHLDAALCRGDFDANGPLVGLDAGVIADGLAADFDDRKQGMLWEAGRTTLCAADILPYVKRWLAFNAETI